MQLIVISVIKNAELNYIIGKDAIFLGNQVFLQLFLKKVPILYLGLFLNTSITGSEHECKVSKVRKIKKL